MTDEEKLREIDAYEHLLLDAPVPSFGMILLVVLPNGKVRVTANMSQEKFDEVLLAVIGGEGESREVFPKTAKA